MANGQDNPNPSPNPAKGYLSDIARLVPVEAVTLYTSATSFIWQNSRNLDRDEKMLYLGLVMLVCFALISVVLFAVHKERGVLRYVISVIAFLLWALNVNQSQIMTLIRVDSVIWSGLAAFALMAFTFFAPYVPGMKPKET